MFKINLSLIIKILIPIIIVILILAWFLPRYLGRKELQLISPNGQEIWRAGSNYEIRWKARHIDKVDIVLVKEEEPKSAKIIAKNISAKDGKYNWQIFVWEETSQHYKISIFESPWREGNMIDYSDTHFTILGPKFASCDQVSIENDWLFVPSDFPNLRKVFFTKKAYSGDMRGLEGADQICQEEAKELGLEGNWKAFLGDEFISAKERLNLEGIFVGVEGGEAIPQERIPAYLWKSFGEFLKTLKDKRLVETLTSAYLTLEEYFKNFSQEWNLQQEKRVCLPFLGKNFEEFFRKISSPFLLEKGKPRNGFLVKFRKEIWLGRIEKEITKTCISIFGASPKDLARAFSYTSTCQNWRTNKKSIDDPPQQEELPHCYVNGLKISPLGIAGFSLNISSKEDKEIVDFISGKTCDVHLKLLCIQQ